MRTLGYEALKVNLAAAAVPGLTETAVCYAPCAYTQAAPPASHSLPGGGGTGGDPSSKVVKTIVGCGEAGELALNALHLLSSTLLVRTHARTHGRTAPQDYSRPCVGYYTVYTHDSLTRACVCV